MPRTVNVAARAIRRDAFVDTAQRLMQAKGFEQMSVQDVLDELGASKGAFYHYFDSKAALLDAIVERMVDQALVALDPVVASPELSAPDKVREVFTGVAAFKAERKELLLALIGTWLSDDNILVREKFRRSVMLRFTPVLARIVRQGVAEGSFDVSSADDTARVFVALILGLNEAATDLFLARQANSVPFELVERTLAAYGEAADRVLGAPPGTLPMLDEATLHFWFG